MPPRSAAASRCADCRRPAGAGWSRRGAANGTGGGPGWNRRGAVSTHYSKRAGAPGRAGETAPCRHSRAPSMALRARSRAPGPVKAGRQSLTDSDGRAAADGKPPTDPGRTPGPAGPDPGPGRPAPATPRTPLLHSIGDRPCVLVVTDGVVFSRASPSRPTAVPNARTPCLVMARAEGPCGHQLKIRHPSQLAVGVRDSDEWGLIESR